jgi:hypothetical protein
MPHPAITVTIGNTLNALRITVQFPCLDGSSSYFSWVSPEIENPEGD